MGVICLLSSILFRILVVKLNPPPHTHTHNPSHLLYYEYVVTDSDVIRC